MTIYFYKTQQVGALLRKAKLNRVHESSVMPALLGLRINEETDSNLVLVLLEGVEVDQRLILENLSCNPVPVIVIEALSISHTNQR